MLGRRRAEAEAEWVGERNAVRCLARAWARVLCVRRFEAAFVEHQRRRAARRLQATARRREATKRAAEMREAKRQVFLSIYLKKKKKSTDLKRHTRVLMARAARCFTSRLPT
jgi:hypothetical protein